MKHTKDLIKELLNTRLRLILSGAIILLAIVLTFSWLVNRANAAISQPKEDRLVVNTYSFHQKEDSDSKGSPQIVLPCVYGDIYLSFDETNEREREIRNGEPIISEKNWEPSRHSARLIKIANNGTLAARAKVFINTIDGGLGEVLWYELVPVTKNIFGKLVPVDGFNLDNAEKRISEVSKDAEKIGIIRLMPNESRLFVLVYGMYSVSGNTYQGKDFAASISVIATQDID